MDTPFISRERTPLSGSFQQKFLDVNGNEFYWKIQINKKIGEGRTCLCYDVEVEKGQKNCQRMILKQFYPELGAENEISARLEGTKLTIDFLEARPDIQALADKFEEAFFLQNRLASAIDQVVKPSVNYFDGETKLVLYEANSGESLDHFMKDEPHQLEEMLEAIAETGEALHAVHEAGFVYMDLKPENILWNHKQVKLFDFDAAISLEKEEEIYAISHDGRREKAQTLAPELRGKEDKRAFLTPRADIYALGCLLFEYIMGRCPTDKECFYPEIWKDGFHDRMHENYGDQFEYKIQEELYKVLCESINYDMTRRYRTAREMADSVKIICARILAEDKTRARQADYNLLSAYVLDTYPVFRYKYRKEEVFALDVCLIGNGEMRDAFFKNIFSCAQMLNTELHIRLVSSDAKEYMEKLVGECPQLIDTTNIYIGDSLRYNLQALNHKITKEPFASFYFYETEEELFIPEASRYFLIACKEIGQNKVLAEKLCEKLEAKTEQRYFVGYGKRGNGGCGVTTDIHVVARNIHVQAFCCDANTTEKEKLFKTSIYKRALGVHSFYTKEWNKKADKQWVKEDLYRKDETGNFYNLKSSLRCALSIKYKFDACNIPQNEDNARVFYERVLAPDAKGGKELFEKIGYLEHRSWMCFMIMEGYRRPSVEELEHYFYKDGNDHRNKREKLHPCISASDLNAAKKLRNLERGRWNDKELLTDMDYDEHDRMSLRIHMLAGERMNEIELLDIYTELQEKMDAGEETAELLSLMKMRSRLAREYNRFHDYYQSNATIIFAIPRLMMKENQYYQRIYKTPSGKAEDMAASAILLEPKELILLKDKAAGCVEEIETILKENGLGDIKVTECPLEDVIITAKSKKAALDITGCSPEYMMQLFLQGFIDKLPVIRYEDGKLLSEKGAEDVRYYYK